MMRKSIVVGKLFQFALLGAFSFSCATVFAGTQSRNDAPYADAVHIKMVAYKPHGQTVITQLWVDPVALRDQGIMVPVDAPPVVQECEDDNEGGGGDGGSGGSDGGGYSNPNGSPPDFGPPPDPPTDIDDEIGTVITRTTLDGWTRQTTYNRPIYPGGTHGPWGNPIINISPPGGNPNDECDEHEAE
jgi:hypothetical protein